MTSYHADKPNFLEFWVKMAKMTLKVKANDPYFQYQPRVSHDAYLVQIWLFHLKSVTSYRADKVNFMDGRMDRRRQRQYPFSLKGQGVKKDPVITITRFNSIVFVIENARGGYSLYVGWYGCAAVLTPFFDILRIELDLFGVFFLIHQHQNDLLGY